MLVFCFLFNFTLIWIKNENEWNSFNFVFSKKKDWPRISLFCNILRWYFSGSYHGSYNRRYCSTTIRYGNVCLILYILHLYCTHNALCQSIIGKNLNRTTSCCHQHKIWTGWVCVWFFFLFEFWWSIFFLQELNFFLFFPSIYLQLE